MNAKPQRPPADLVQINRRRAGVRQVFLFVMGLIMNSLASHQAAAADHIEIVREVLLEAGQSAFPKQLAPTKDGGFIVAGSISERTPWATRVDAQGKVRWRFLLEMEQWQPGAGDAGYESAATLPDDTTMLAGFRTARNPKRAVRGVVGLLTHIDKTGKVIRHQELYPQNDDNYPASYLRKSAPWGDGVAVIGETLRWRKVDDHHVEDDFIWLVALSAIGEIKWEKLIPADRGNHIIGATELPNHDLLLVTTDWQKRGAVTETGRRVIRLNDKGEVVGERFFPGDLLLTHDVQSQPGITLLPELAGHGAIWTVDGDLMNAKQTTGDVNWIFAEAACRSSTGAFVLGGSLQGTHKAAIAWLSADLRSTESFVFQPLGASGRVEDVLPTATQDEILTVRRISGAGGAALTFIKIK